jgi:hypothetical protein
LILYDFWKFVIISSLLNKFLENSCHVAHAGWLATLMRHPRGADAATLTGLATRRLLVGWYRFGEAI